MTEPRATWLTQKAYDRLQNAVSYTHLTLPTNSEV